MPEVECPNVAAIPDWMVIDAVRYAVGRRSYQVGLTCDWLVAHWAGLTGPVRAQIARDLEREFRRHDELVAAGRPDGGGWLGYACDVAQWRRVRALWHPGPDIEISIDQAAYLAEIGDVAAALRPDAAVRALARGCPDPAYYADEPGWDGGR